MAVVFASLAAIMVWLMIVSAATAIAHNEFSHLPLHEEERDRMLILSGLSLLAAIFSLIMLGQSL